LDLVARHFQALAAAQHNVFRTQRRSCEGDKQEREPGAC
jgi:hypothetical protein